MGAAGLLPLTKLESSDDGTRLCGLIIILQLVPQSASPADERSLHVKLFAMSPMD